MGYVDQRLLDDFLSRLMENVCPVDCPSTGFLPIPRAAEKSRRLSKDILHLLLDRRLNRVEMVRGTSGYLAVLVNPTEIADLLPVAQEHLPPKKTEVAETLRVPLGAVNALLEGAGGEPLLHAVSDLRPGPTTLRFDEGEVERFRRKYVTLGELKQISGQHHMTLLERLAALDIVPIRDPKLLKCYVFVREEASRALE